MKERLTGAEFRPCVAGEKGEGLSTKCQCFSCEARLIKGGLVSDRWPHWTSNLWWGNLMHQNRYETWMRHMNNMYSSTHTATRARAHTHTHTAKIFRHIRWQVLHLLSLWEEYYYSKALMLPGCESLMYSTNAKANMSIIITNAVNNGKDNYVVMSTDLKFSLGFCFVFVVRFFLDSPLLPHCQH